MTGEKLLQHIWWRGIYHKKPMKTGCGKKITILRRGEFNMHSGPDFLNALILIDGIKWAGNVEVHLKSSGWVKHKHHLDPAYDSVILHVVAEDDCPVFNSQGNRIPALVIRIPAGPWSGLATELHEKAWPLCHAHLQNVPRVRLHRWLTDLMTERLQAKTGKVNLLIHQMGPDWENILYRMLAYGFGLPVNSLPFELTVKSIPYSLVMRHRHNIFDLEALFLGQAGFLSGIQHPGPYPGYLKERFVSLSRDLGDHMLKSHIWKFLRLRPASFPTLRLSQFASLAHQRFPVLNQLLSADSIAEMEQIFRVHAGEYWNNHYRIGVISPESEKVMGPEAIRSLMINALVPFLFSFGHRKNHLAAIQLGTNIMQDLEAESNRIIRNWIKFGIKPSCAFESQALIHLYNNYCKQNRCLDCRIGTVFFKLTDHDE